MNQTKLTNFLLVLIVILLMGLIGYLALNKTSSELSYVPTVPEIAITPTTSLESSSTVATTPVLDNQPKDEVKSLPVKPLGQLYQDSANYYSYLCPDDFMLGNNLDYNGKVKISECSKNYTDSKFEFVDGISVRFGFVPTSVANTEKNNNVLWSDQKLGIKSTDGAKAYNRNSFSGWLSAVPKSGSGYLNLIARRATAGGYYEVDAIVALNGSNKPTVEERLAAINKIVDSFSVMK